MKKIFIAAVVVLLMSVAAYAALFIAPTESKMGTIQRIFYLHAPSGMVALLSFFVCFVGNLAYVFTRKHTKKERRRSEEHTSELQSLTNLVCRLLLEKKKKMRLAAIRSTPSQMSQ